MGRYHGLEVADIFREYGERYRGSHELVNQQRRVMNAIEKCRTAELGGHMDRCDNEACAEERHSYNSCRNRQCPKCQCLRKEKWLEARKKEIVPVQYFHIVFTLPEEVNELVLLNHRTIYGLLFRSVKETLIDLGLDRKHLGARVGAILVLHTWSQTLGLHPHIHCIVPGGGLSTDGDKWINSRKDFFIHVRVLSELYKQKFTYYLEKLIKKGELRYPDKIKDANGCRQMKRKIEKKSWVVYAKEPFKGVHSVIDYLGSYTHRIAISNYRLIDMKEGKVKFKWRDYKDKNQLKEMELEAEEFIRRFLLHVLPNRYVRIRHVGILSNRDRKKNIEKLQELLGVARVEVQKEKKESWQEQLKRITGIDVNICPKCGKGRMVRQKILLPMNRGP